MSDKSLRFMDKTQLLNIMRQQEIEIERLNAEIAQLASGRDEQIENLTYGSEKLLAEKEAQIKKLSAEVGRLSSEKDGQLERLLAEKDAQIKQFVEEFERLSAQKDAQTKKFIGGVEAMSIEKDAQIERLNDEISRLTAENAELAEGSAYTGAEIGSDYAQIEELLAEKDAYIAERDAYIERLQAKIEGLNAKVDGLAAAGREQGTPLSLENAGSLAEASLSVAGVMRAAQEAADMYLQNIKQIEAEKIAAAEKIVEEARMRADAIIRAAGQKCEELKEAEKRALGDLRNVSYLYMDFIDKSHSALHDMIDRYKITRLTQGDEPGHAAKN